ncbi:patatin-like phospholipase family protein [Salegentibacter mishustinae]|uniref:patatin-like phospholipase family protein n=1 Tax=Salegentibacter mishustinae TaxID=270918 RepID=UPI001CE1B8F6|nr:patatin-like phospholipase family protein [Salegentibacter mishustinae]UBZ07289.1 patatin-like phospholipase family protein [Salegentibacter mishustinae]
MKKIRILSIDGGGIRGILPGTILTYLEDELKKKTNNPHTSISEYFDFFAGTSTGGILTLIYLIPDENGINKYSARDALKIYLEKGEEIFNVPLRNKIESLGGIIDEKYPEADLEKNLEYYFKKSTLSESLKPCLVPSYDIRNRRAHFFTSIEAKRSKLYDFYLKDVARSASAAPTYFEATRINSRYGTPYSLIDGGVFANNPTLCAYAEARNIAFSKELKNPDKPDKPSAKDMLIFSIGTGDVKEPYTYEEYSDAGMLKWIKPLIDIMMSGNSETVDYQLKKIYETLQPADSLDYHRIQPELIHADSAMDNARKENILALHEDGLNTVTENKEELDLIVDKLIREH